MIPLGVLASSRVAPTVGGGLTYIPGSYSGSSAASVTTSGVGIGTASAAREVVIAVLHGGSLNRECTAMTIGGIAATRDASGGSSRAGVHIFRASVPTGTAADVVTTWDSGAGHTFDLYVYTSPAALTVVDTGRANGDGIATTLSVTVATSPGGTVLALASGRSIALTETSFDRDADRGNEAALGRAPGTGSAATVSATWSTAVGLGYGRLIAASYI